MNRFCQTWCIMFLSPGLTFAQTRLKLVEEAVGRPVVQPVSAAAPTDYILGADDQLSIWALEAEDISNRPITIETGGFINLPLIGRIQAAGLTVRQLESDIAKKLATYIKEPKVAVGVTEFRSQPVSVIGAVTNPGVHQIRGKKTLVEVLSLAGGLRQDAGYVLKITRRVEWGPIPLPGATKDASELYTVAEVPLKGIIDAVNPNENIQIRPNDVISVPKGDLVYVIGEVTRAGGFILNERKQMSVLQALAMAGGLTPAAAGQSAKLLRPTAGSDQRTEIAIDLKKILGSKAEDFNMRADDVLFVPTNISKKAAVRAAEAAVQALTGAVIWRSGRY